VRSCAPFQVEAHGSLCHWRPREDALCRMAGCYSKAKKLGPKDSFYPELQWATAGIAQAICTGDQFSEEIRRAVNEIARRHVGLLARYRKRRCQGARCDIRWRIRPREGDDTALALPHRVAVRWFAAEPGVGSRAVYLLRGCAGRRTGNRDGSCRCARPDAQHAGYRSAKFESRRSLRRICGVVDGWHFGDATTEALAFAHYSVGVIGQAAEVQV
jgi:hypothetical protein